MTALNLPIQKHPIDQQGKVFINKEWYLALFSLVTQSNSISPSENIDDVALLEAVDSLAGSEGSTEKTLGDVVALVHALSPQDSTETLIARLREIEIRVALLPDYADPVLQFVDDAQVYF